MIFVPSDIYLMGIAGELASASFTNFAQTHSRTNDPSTSKIAAERAESMSSKHRNIILNVLKKYGALSKDEIAQYCDLNGTQIARRLPDLQDSGLAEPTGETRISESGRPERVWRAI